MALVNEQPVLYYQTDKRWKDVPYAVHGESATIGGSGCGPTSMAMVLATWADSSVNPKTECAWALSHGYKAKGQGTYYGYFVPAAKRYNLTCYQVNSANIYGNTGHSAHATARNAVDSGDFVIACMGKGNWTRSGHYVLVWGVDGNTVFINDPASSSIARTRGSYALFKQQVKYYWVIKRPANRPLRPGEEAQNVDFSVRNLDREGLNCRKGPGLSYTVVKVYPYETEIRIFQTLGAWGKTEHGWVNLTNTERVSDLTEAQTKKLIAEALAENNKVLGDQITEAIKAAVGPVYNDEKEIPDWYREAFEKVKPVLKGTGSGLGLRESELRILTLLDRMGKL